MLKSESQMCAGFCSAGEGEYWSIRLNQRVKEGVQLRDICNFNFNFHKNAVLFNFYFIISSLRPLFANFSQVASVMMPASFPP